MNPNFHRLLTGFICFCAVLAISLSHPRASGCPAPSDRLQATHDVFLSDDLFVPAVLSAPGLNNSVFSSELTLANRGSQSATLEFRYAATEDMGGGSGTATDLLPAGRQRIVPDAIEYLRSLGVPI